MQKDGTAVTDAAERLRIVQQACDTFRDKSLPHLAQLGIVQRA